MAELTKLTTLELDSIEKFLDHTKTIGRADRAKRQSWECKLQIVPKDRVESASYRSRQMIQPRLQATDCITYRAYRQS